MIAVIFEVWPAEGQGQRHLDLAATLRDELETLDGFLSVERFQSQSDAGKLLSLSFSRDEAAVEVGATAQPTARPRLKDEPVSSPTIANGSPASSAITA